MTRAISAKVMRLLPKINLHEHLDCSVRPRTLLELWSEIGFDKSTMGFPPKVVGKWKAAQLLRTGRTRFVAAQSTLVHGCGPTQWGHKGKQSPDNIKFAEELEAEAATIYQKFLARFASKSLANYVKAIVDHVLPVMQTSLNLSRITEERIEDAIQDGIIGMELRFAPQLHIAGGLSLELVMESVIAALKKSPIPVYLTICSLRHEDAEMARKLGDLCLQYPEYVGCFDLAADEAANPGVLDWWLTEAVDVRDHRAQTKYPLLLKTHLWETNEPTDDDIAKLDANGITILGHGFRGNRQGTRTLEICPISNVVTGQVASIEQHPIAELVKDPNRRPTINTDGTLFTRADLTDNYLKCQKAFGWGRATFWVLNKYALEASNFSRAQKVDLMSRLNHEYAGNPLSPRHDFTP